MNERPQPRRGRSSTRLFTAAPGGARWAWRTTFALWSTWCAKRSEREHPHSKKHKHLLHSFTSLLVRLLKKTIAASILAKFQAFPDAMPLEPNIAASILPKFEALSDAIGVAVHLLVAPAIREVAQESFDQRSGLTTESVINPFALLASARDPRVAQQRQMSRKRGLCGFECIA